MKHTLLLLTTALLFTACGGGSSTPTEQPQVIDNGRLSDGIRDGQGFIGHNVVFGNTVIPGVWNITFNNEGHTQVRFFANGEYSDTYNQDSTMELYPGTWGVSIGGDVLYAKDNYGTVSLSTITITQTLGANCYNAIMDRFYIEGYGTVRDTPVRICKQ